MALEETRSEWVSLDEVAQLELERRFGELAVRCHEARRASEGVPRSWWLDKQSFRRAVRALLPAGHQPLELAAKRSQRVIQAARAHERLTVATSFVPQLPESIPGARFLVWASPMIRPRKASEGVYRGGALEVDRADVPRAVAALFARVYLDASLRRLPARAKKFDLAIGLVELEGAIPAALEALLAAAPSPTVELPPWPALAAREESLCPLEAELLALAIPAWQAAASRWGAPLDRAVFFREESRLGIDLALLREAARKAPTALSRLLLHDCLGKAEPSRALSHYTERPLAWASVASEVRAQLQASRALVAQVEAEATRIEERRAWLREMDLAILPDDGLRRTIEEGLSALRQSQRVAVEATFAAQFQGRVAELFSGTPLEVIEVGARLVSLEVLLAFEECMSRVREDAVAVRALTEGEPLPPGSAERALWSFVDQHAEWGPFEESRQLGPVLLETARLALPCPFDVAEAHRHARAEADRELARAEQERPRFWGAWASLRRAEAREAVSLRERARLTELQAHALLLQVFTEVDRRLPRLDPGLSPRSALFCTVQELIETVDLRGASLRARVEWRRVSQRASSLSGQESTSELVGLAVLRELHELLRLPYRSGPVSYAGRATDTWATTARALGISFVYGRGEEP